MAAHDGATRARARGARTGIAICLIAILVACTPDPATGPTTTTAPTTTTTAPPGDDAFTVVFIGDSEPRMRGNTNAEVAAYVGNLVAYRTTKVAHFDYDGGRYRVDPSLVILGGDISADRDTSIDADMPIWQSLYANGIPFVAGFGNHDWDPPTWSDGSPGYSVAGHLSNEATKAFTRETYRRSAELTPAFTYREINPTSVNGPVTFLAHYRGVDIANFNTFLYQPSYYYPDGWPLSCNLVGGGAGCEIFTSAEPQIQAMQNLLPTDPATPVLFVEHYPLTTGDSWWDDSGASGTTIAQKKARLMGLMAQHDNTILLAGHNHSASQSTYTFGGTTLKEYVAPYFGGDNGEDLSRGGGFVAVLVSPTRGILEVKTIPGGV